ncbi:MAG: hypothetical protein ACYTEQ_21060 [Planctomycetota bacterium]
MTLCFRYHRGNWDSREAVCHEPRTRAAIQLPYHRCWDEVHKTGNICKKPESEDNLMTYNRGEMAYLPGFNLAPGEWSLWTISIERLSSSSVHLSITLNGRTYTDTDDSSNEQPSKIDVFAIHMRNGRPYSRLVLAKP